MEYQYDSQNVFAKILRDELPSSKINESEYTLAFHDINASAPHHILVIPKGPYINFDHFINSATNLEIIDFNKTISTIIGSLNLNPTEGGDGYRLIANAGINGLQEVPHYHVHLLAGRPLGQMVQKESKLLGES